MNTYNRAPIEASSGLGEVRIKLAVAVLLLVILILSQGLPISSLCETPGDSASEVSVEATLKVVLPATEAYGAAIVDSSGANAEKLVLGEPDWRGAVLPGGGYVRLLLDEAVPNCTGVAIWAASRGPVASFCCVHVSADGVAWTLIAEWVCVGNRFTCYEAQGDFGSVAFLQVSLPRPSAWNPGVFTLDAVVAKGGEMQAET